MTILALLSLRAFVNIIIAMARDAGRMQLRFKYWLDVAIVACNRLVGAVQQVVRVAVMIEFRLLPFHRVMTRVALVTTVSFVLIVFQVAGNARAIHFIIKRVFAMAVVTSRIAVAALERKFRIATVIEARIVPADRIVTIATVVAASTIVGIVLLVTRVTIVGRAQVRRIFMAIQTACLEMFADQWVAGCFMIENGIGPTGRVMAVNASSPETVLVYVVVPMTVDTQPVCIAEFVGRLVTVGTQGIEMFALQFEVGKQMIERGFIQAHDIRCAALVIRVAGSAAAGTGVLESAVKSGLVSDVFANLLVTLYTQGVLFRPGETLVTGRALVLCFGVRLHHFAGHDE